TVMIPSGRRLPIMTGSGPLRLTGCRLSMHGFILPGAALMRVGVFGGTFDPVHYGHLILAEQCREQGRLDEVWFVPAPRPPRKEGHTITRFEQRVEMLALAVAGHPPFRIDELEKDRPGPSYTVETIAELHRRH